jgi:hypothetical protein
MTVSRSDDGSLHKDLSLTFTSHQGCVRPHTGYQVSDVSSMNAYSRVISLLVLLHCRFPVTCAPEVAETAPFPRLQGTQRVQWPSSRTGYTRLLVNSFPKLNLALNKWVREHRLEIATRSHEVCHCPCKYLRSRATTWRNTCYLYTSRVDPSIGAGFGFMPVDIVRQTTRGLHTPSTHSLRVPPKIAPVPKTRQQYPRQTGLVPSRSCKELSS